MAAEAAACELSQHQLLHLGDPRLEHLTLVSAEAALNADQSTTVLSHLTLQELSGQTGLPSLGLVPTCRRRGQGQGSAEAGPCGRTKGTIDC